MIIKIVFYFLLWAVSAMAGIFIAEFLIRFFDGKKKE